MKKNLLLFLGISVLCITFFACERDDIDDKKSVNTPIADYLYGVEYDDYDFHACLEHFNNILFSSYPACTEVRKGKFVGRNLDWYTNNDASAIIKVNRTADHYASIGMIGCFSDFSNALAKSGEYSDTYQYLPFKTVDGINEKGLYIGVNVAPTGETSFDPTTWEPYAFGHGATHTNPESNMHYCVNYLVRIVLDRAGSVEEAKKVIDGIDWCEPVNYPSDGISQALHWLICDAKQSVVLDFIDNKAVYTDAPSINEPSLGNIMTNFSNCLYAKGLIQSCASGLERWDIINANYASTPATFEGMEELMSKVWYSKTYTTDPSSHDFWLTECCDPTLPASYLYKNYNLCDNEEFCNSVRNFLAGFHTPSTWHVDNTIYWYTTHTSVYDLENKTLRVLVHEGLDEQKTYYEASLKKSKFAKPLGKR